MRSLIQSLVPRALLLFIASKSGYGFPAGNPEHSLENCLLSAVGNNSSLIQFPFEPGYYASDVHPYNLNYNYTPAVILYPHKPIEVATIVSCAAKHGRKVQARGGGHDLTNKALGRTDGVIVVDMKNMNAVNVDSTTGMASVGGGAKLRDIAYGLHEQGRRYMPHGASDSVGIGGHATIGGLGLHSRLEGSSLDVLREAEVVLANGTIVYASEDENVDIFWAIRGAGASFGIVTEFRFQTQPEPKEIMNFEYVVASEDHLVLADAFKAGQEIMANKTLDRRFNLIAIIRKNAVIFTGAFFGPANEYMDLGIQRRIPGIQNSTELFGITWIQHVERLFESSIAVFPAGEYFDSLGTAVAFETLPSSDTIDRVFQHMQTQDPGSDDWYGFVDWYGGAINDVDVGATAFPHRDLSYFFAVYVTTTQPSTQTTNHYVDQTILEIQNNEPEKFLNYVGYGNPRMPTPQQTFWGSNLPRLERIKASVDPKDVFSTSDGVKPLRD